MNKCFYFIFSFACLTICFGYPLQAQEEEDYVDEEPAPYHYTDSESEFIAEFKLSEGKMSKRLKTGEWNYYYPWQELSYMRKQLRASGSYKKGERHGEWTMYSKLNQVDSVGTYIKGKKEGIWKIRQNLIWVAHTVFKNDKILSSETYYNERLSKTTAYFEGGYRDTMYFDDGNVKFWQEYNMEGEVDGWAAYFRNGYPYKKTKMKGYDLLEMKWYHPDGKLKSMQTFHPDTAMYKLYHTNDQLLKFNTYSNGKLHNTKRYNGEGELLDHGSFKDGKGTLHEFDADGTITNTEEY